MCQWYVYYAYGCVQCYRMNVSSILPWKFNFFKLTPSVLVPEKETKFHSKFTEFHPFLKIIQILLLIQTIFLLFQLWLESLTYALLCITREWQIWLRMHLHQAFAFCCCYCMILFLLYKRGSRFHSIFSANFWNILLISPSVFNYYFVFFYYFNELVVI